MSDIERSQDRSSTSACLPPPAESGGVAPGAASAFGLDLLGFSLPDFARQAWTSDRARLAWEPRIQAVARAWPEIEWQSVLTGIRACNVTVIPADRLPLRSTEMMRRGLVVLPLEVQGLASSTYAHNVPKVVHGAPFGYRVAIARSGDLERFEEAWRAADDVTIGELLGYPDCCREFFRAVWVDHGLRDTSWAMAYQSAGLVPGSRELELVGSPFANVLCRWLGSGVRPVFHLPCRCDCPRSVEIGRRLLDLGRDLGFQEEMGWLLEILSWPLEWSALHGIAEIKTPVMKVCVATDATATRFSFRLRGSSFPAEGARGLGHAFHMPHPPRVTSSNAYGKGLANPLPVVSGDRTGSG